MERGGTLGRVVGRYRLYDEIASGGMASIHIGRLQGPVGFSRTVAIKRLHPQYAKDPEFVSMFLDEARLAARVQHPNVVATVDVIALGGELFLVMEYVQGETLSRLLRAVREMGMRVPPRIAVGIVADALYGLHAAHEARTEAGEPLAIVHRDVSPHNIIVGKDGVARVLDFGIAKAASRLQTTRDGQVKGKIAYMAPEQLQQRPVDRRTDVFAASVVLWEALTGQRLFGADNEGGTVTRVLFHDIQAPSSVVPDIPRELDSVVLKGLERDPDARFRSAMEMAAALENTITIARPAEIGAYVERVAGEILAQRARRIAQIEGTSSDAGTVPLAPHRSDAPRADEPTQVSQTETLSTGPPIRVLKRTWIVALGIAVLLGAVTVLTWFSAQARTRADAPAIGTTPPSLALSPPSTTIAQERATETVGGRPTEGAGSNAPPRVGRTEVRHRRSHVCDQPFIIDDAGVKRYKSACL